MSTSRFEIAPADFDPAALPTQFYENPWDTYARLRSEAPVLALPGGGFFLTRHEDLDRVYRDPRRFSSDKRSQFAPVFGRDSLLFEHHTTSLVFNDPPLHTHVRKAIGNALSNRVVTALRTDVEAVVDDLLASFAPGGEIDAIGDFAAAIPVEIIGNLLAVPYVAGPWRSLAVSRRVRPRSSWRRAIAPCANSSTIWRTSSRDVDGRCGPGTMTLWRGCCAGSRTATVCRRWSSITNASSS